MPRPTRAERQAATRSDILAVARRRFLDQGYAATSLDDIAEEAGYSKGAVYSNFRDKPTLCRAVLESVHEEKLGEVVAIAEGDTTIEARLEVLEQWLERTVGDVGWTMLELEFAVLSRRNPELADMITNLHVGMHATVVETLGTVVGGTGDPAGPSLDAIADMILATTIGLGVQRAVDPSVSIEPAITAIRGVAAALIPTG
ncbi:TetR/AcrR family transcriptional regulator [Gordonia sinesedis]